jgi:hypothetical protein
MNFVNELVYYTWAQRLEQEHFPLPRRRRRLRHHRLLAVVPASSFFSGTSLGKRRKHMVGIRRRHQQHRAS